MNILEIIVAAVTLLFAVLGFRKGFVRKITGIASLVLSVLLVSAVLPYVTDFLKNSTPVYSYIEEWCDDMIEKQVTGDSRDSSGQESEGNTPAWSGKLTRIEQTELIEKLPVPETVKDMLLDYNNEEGYRELKVSTFQEYIVGFLATGILNIAAFLLSLIVVNLVVWLIFRALNLAARLPLIGFVNRLAGLLLGILQALLLLWLFFLILSLTSSTETGLRLLGMVQESQLLGTLYDTNVFLDIVLSAVAIL